MHIFLHSIHTLSLNLINIHFLMNSPLESCFSGIRNLSSKCNQFCLFSYLSISDQMGRLRTGLLCSLIKTTAISLLTCILALGGAIVGTISGGIKGQTTETGLFRGAGIGAVAGAITAVQLMELMLNGESFSKVALFHSLVNGKIFMEWVSPAVLKAYQWQISTTDANLREISDIFEVNGTRGLSREVIRRLPRRNYHSNGAQDSPCAICLTDFKGGECTRMMPICRHSFHQKCIDEWLYRHGSCPVCRIDI